VPHNISNIKDHLPIISIYANASLYIRCSSDIIYVVLYILCGLYLANCVNYAILYLSLA
jgi:hypothetical protein